MKERLTNDEEFCSQVPIDLASECRIQLDKVGYRHQDFNEKTGQMYLKSETFTKIWNTADSSYDTSSRKPGIREQQRINKVSTGLQENLFKPVTIDGVEYKANSQALLYRYFTTLKAQTLKVNSDN